MFGIGEGELAIIVVFGFLLFGPDKLPQMGRTIGRAIRQFRETQEKMTAVVQSEIIDPVSEAASAPVKPKKAAVDDDSDADEDAAEPVVEPEPAAEPESEPEPAEPTTADLYARRPRKRKAVVDQLARELEAEDDAAAADAPKGGDE